MTQALPRQVYLHKQREPQMQPNLVLHDDDDDDPAGRPDESSKDYSA